MSDPVLRTPRLLMRRMDIGDLEDLHAVFTREEAMRYWSRPPHDSRDDTRTFIEGTVASHARGEADDFAVVHEGRVIGKAGAWRLAEIGFILHPDHWGRGLGREALTAVVAHLFAAHPVDRLTAETDPRNGASITLLSRLGFRETHRAERTMQWRDEWCDSVYFGLERGPDASVTAPRT